MSLNGMAESRRHWCHRRVWLKCSKTVARWSQVLPVRACHPVQQALQDSAPSPSAIARILYRGPGQARLSYRPPSPLTGLRRDKPPAQYRGRAGRQGSNWTRGPRRLATSRPVEVLCASPAALVRAKRQGVPQVRQTLGVPRAVFNRLAPRPPRWSSLSSLGRLPPWSGPGTRQRFCDGSLPPTGHHEPAACDGHARTGAAWTAGPSHRISDARS